MLRQVEYFGKAGPENTAKCLEIVDKIINEGPRHVVVATTEGATGLAFARRFQNKKVNLVVVTHNINFNEPGQDQCSQQARKELLELGVKVFTGPILTRGIESSLMKKHQGVYPAYIVAETLRLFSQGVKVAVEITMAACDAGLVPEGEDVIAVAGTSRGADTVVIIQARPSNRFLDLRVRQILAKPL